MKKIKICIISDTHNYHKQLILPNADMIIHCGDFTGTGKENEIRKFMKWYSNLDQFKHKIIIAGNHDFLFEDSGSWARGLVPKNVHYLEDSGVEIEGFKFYGTPVQLPFNGWAFNRPEEILKKHWEAIPTDTDILITHGAPYSILDLGNYSGVHTGSPSLYWEVIERIKPLVSTFGHIHEGYGVKVIDNTTFINASNLDEKYDYTNSPILVEINNKKTNIIN